MDRNKIVYGACALFLIAVLAPSAAAASGCIPTATDFLGPFFVSGMPIAEDINRFGKAGEPLTVSGIVRSAAGDNRPIANARIEIWQTDGSGRYYPENNGARSDYKDTELDMRGAVVTDANGRYSFRTVVPGAERTHWAAEAYSLSHHRRRPSRIGHPALCKRKRKHARRPVP